MQTPSNKEHHLSRRLLIIRRTVRFFFVLLILACLFVLVDFSTTDQEDDGHGMIRVELPEMQNDTAYFIKTENKQLVVVKYSQSLKAQFFNNTSEPTVIKPKNFFVAWGYGTNMGCPLQAVADKKLLKETCSPQLYDFSGQAVEGRDDFTALRVPVYTFCPDKSCINISLR